MAISREYLLDDSDWCEVSAINSYAVFIGYLSMAIKGLGFLVLTWTTVVLLGGFVSMLQKEDFWCLTFITLVQTAGIFDANMNEKLGYMRNAITGLVVGVYSGVYSSVLGDPEPTLADIGRPFLATVLSTVQAAVLVTLLCPLAIIYVFGILMSGGISLWRLIEHDYRGNSDGETSNLEPAMDTLYYLALLQGVLLCYRFMLGRVAKKLTKKAIFIKCDDNIVQSVSNYLRETKIGCEKDPSFAKGRNLITHAIDKIGSNSPVDCVFGVRILCAAICIAEMQMRCRRVGSDDYRKHRDIVCGQSMLMRHLLGSVSSSRHTMQKLLETLDSRGLHDRKTRGEAAFIATRLAYIIKLEEFPRGIQHISSLIGTLEEYIIAEPYQQDNDKYGFQTPSPTIDDDAMCKFEEDYMLLMQRGLEILTQLAADENNRRVMSDTRDLISKIMAPVTSDLVHNTTNDHGVWSGVVQRSMNVILQLIGARETGAKICHEISSCEEAISTLWRIIACHKCNEELQQRAFWILTKLYYRDTECSRLEDFVDLKKESSNHNKEYFVTMLLVIFTQVNKYSSYTRAHAGIALSWICFHGGICDVAKTVRETNGGDVVYWLTELLVHDEVEACRQAAAEVLENLCTHYTKNDECTGKLKKAMTNAMPEVLGEIVCLAGKTHTGKETDHDGLPKQKSDIENQCAGTQENSERNREGKEFQAVTQPVDSTELLSSFLSLCATVYDIMFIGDLPQVDMSRFLTKLREVVVEKSNPIVENLLLCKVASKIVISMMKCSGGRFFKQEDLGSFIVALSGASNRMLNLDHSMVFRSAHIFQLTVSKHNGRTLASFVKEAKELSGSMGSYSSE